MNGKKLSEDSPCILTEDVFRTLPVFDGELDSSPYFTEIYHESRHKNLREQLLYNLFLQ